MMNEVVCDANELVCGANERMMSCVVSLCPVVFTLSVVRSGLLLSFTSCRLGKRGSTGVGLSLHL